MSIDFYLKSIDFFYLRIVDSKGVGVESRVNGGYARMVEVDRDLFKRYIVIVYIGGFGFRDAFCNIVFLVNNIVSRI